MATIFLSLFMALPFFFTETTLPAMLFLLLSGGGQPTDLAAHLPEDVVAYARIAGQEDAGAAVKKAVESAREDLEFQVLMDAMLGEMKEAGFKAGGFEELGRRIRAIHVAVYSFGKEGAIDFTLVFETTGEDAAGELLDHSDRFFEQAMFEKVEGEGRYRFAPAGDEGLAVRAKNLVFFGPAAEKTVAAMSTPPENTLAASETYRKALGESGGSFLLAYGNGSRFFADLKASLDFDDQKEFDQADSLGGFTEIEWARVSCAFRDGRFWNESVVGLPEDAMARVFAPKAADLDADLFLRAGGDAAFGILVADPKAYWAAIEAHLLEQEKALGWEEISEALGQFKEATGKSAGEFFALLDGRMVLGMPPMDQLLEMAGAERSSQYHEAMEDAEPEATDFPVTIAVRLADPTGAKEFLDHLFSPEGPMAEAKRLESVTHEGVTIQGFEIERTRFRWYLDSGVFVLGGKDLEASIDRTRGDTAAARAAIEQRLHRLGPTGFFGFLGGSGSAMMGSAFLFISAREMAYADAMGGGEVKRARRVPYRKPIEPAGEIDAVGSARFEPIGLVIRASVPVDRASVQGTSAMLLRMYFEAKVDNCLSSLEAIYTGLHAYHAENEKWPAALEEAVSDERNVWIMGCPDVQGSSDKPSSAYTYLVEKPEGTPDEDALWVFDSEARHPFGRAVLYRDGKVTFLYEDEFQEALAKSK